MESLVWKEKKDVTRKGTIQISKTSIQRGKERERRKERIKKLYHWTN